MINYYYSEYLLSNLALFYVYTYSLDTYGLLLLFTISITQLLIRVGGEMRAPGCTAS